MAFHELDQFEIDPGSAQMLPLELCERNLVCILGDVRKLNPAAAVPLAMLDPTDDAICREVELKIQRRVRPIQLNEFEIHRAIAKGFGLKTDQSDVHAQVFLDYLRKIEFAPNQSPSKLLDDVLSAAVTRGATDIHIENFRRDVDVRFRVDGVLTQTATPISPDNVKKVVSRVKVLCHLDIAAKPKPMDGRFSAKYAAADGTDRVVNFRVSIVPVAHGEDCVVRILDAGRGLTTLDNLGMAANALHTFKTLLSCPSGMILVTGPTGCGKTTTLYSALKSIQTSGKKICTVEDPIEYQLAKVNQTQVSEDIGFAEYTKAFLRQDPDVLLIGEIRDEETAQVAVRAAMTGHLVLATLHTQDAVSSVARLRTLGVDDEILSDVLLGALAQRLIRKNCPHCLTAYAPRAETFVRFYADDPGHAFYRGKGCERCEQEGYLGRLGLFEVFVADDVMKASICSHETIEQVKSKARERGYVPLVDEALQRVAAGVTTIEEVERTVRPLYYV